MTIFQRLPNPFDATQKLQRSKSPSADPATTSNTGGSGPRAGETAAQRTDALDMYFGDAKSARRLTKVIALADSQSARIIGIAGARAGVGASTAARELTGAFASVGRKALLVDVSGAPEESSAGATTARTVSLLAMSREVRPALSIVDLGAYPDVPPLSLSELRSSFEEATRKGYTVIVDLPAVGQVTERPPAIVASGPACDLVYLVCLSGEMNRRELTVCLQTCGIIGIRVGGLILNDWYLPASGLLES